MSNPVTDGKGHADKTSHSGSIVVAAPGVGMKNLLTELAVISSSIATITISSNGVTLFQITALPANTPFVKSWQRGLGATINQDLTIAVSAGTYDINAQVVTA